MSSFLGIFEISASGMNAERMRLEVATMNIANASTVKTRDGVVYQPMRVLTRPAALKSFESHFGTSSIAPVGVSAEMAAIGNSTRQVYDPEHPYADDRGFVEQAAVDPTFEMTQIMQAVRAYEANIKTFGAARSMIQSALRIGERS